MQEFLLRAKFHDTKDTFSKNGCLYTCINTIMIPDFLNSPPPAQEPQFLEQGAVASLSW